MTEASVCPDIMSNGVPPCLISASRSSKNGSGGANHGLSPRGRPRKIAQHRMARRATGDDSDAQTAAVPPMPWFGMDIGGTLTKLVYFEPTDTLNHEEDTKTLADHNLLGKIKRYLTINKAYGQSGHRDSHLEMRDVMIDGRTGVLHFIRFPTAQMNAFIELAKDKGMARLASTVCATGGGAYKFEDRVEKEVGMKLHKFDELDSLMRGVEYMEHFNASELFYYENPQDEEDCQKTVYQGGAIYPFILVNIGSGVSILSVKSPDEYRRVCGTSLGGGTFLGLCSLLTDCKDFEEALSLAAQGDNTNVDKLVRDIYGGDYEKFGLQGDLVASSFGHMSDAARRCNARPEDLARATLTTITNNIGSLVKLCAQAESLERVVFVGNFLRVNSISMKMLAVAMHFWSQGSTKALFCEHEGYFGAVGCLLELMKTP